MEIETFDRLRLGLNSFHKNLLLDHAAQKVVSTSKDRSHVHFLWLCTSEKLLFTDKIDR